MMLQRLSLLVIILFTQVWVPCTCESQGLVNDEKLRITVLNRSGGPVRVHWINHYRDDERVLMHERVQNGTIKAMATEIGHVFEVVQLPNASLEECRQECRKATFQVDQRFGISSVVTIDEGLEANLNEYKTVYPEEFKRFKEMYPQEKLRLNSDFSLLPEMNSIPYALSVDQRMKWQMRRFRTRPISGVIENKLLSYSVLHSMKIPTPEIYYAAFAHTSMGDWPEYDRDAFISAMKNTPQVAEDHLFVIKPATGFGTSGVLVMNHEKWERENWTIEELAEFVEWVLLLSFTDDEYRYEDQNIYWPKDYGQRYDHRAVLVLQSVLPQDANVEFSSASFDDFVSENRVPVFELKTHVVFGQLCWARIQTVPIKFDAFVDISFCDGEPSFLFASGLLGADRDLWLAARPVILKHWERIAEAAEKITNAYGVDMFRLDTFMDDNGLFMINELSYGSFCHARFDCTNRRLVDTYKMGTFDMLNATSVLESLLQRINVPLDVFMDSPDYRERTEEDYDYNYGDPWSDYLDFTEEDEIFEETGIWGWDDDDESPPSAQPTGMCAHHDF